MEAFVYSFLFLVNSLTTDFFERVLRHQPLLHEMLLAPTLYLAALTLNRVIRPRTLMLAAAAIAISPFVMEWLITGDWTGAKIFWPQRVLAFFVELVFVLALGSTVVVVVWRPSNCTIWQKWLLAIPFVAVLVAFAYLSPLPIYFGAFAEYARHPAQWFGQMAAMAWYMFFGSLFIAAGFGAVPYSVNHISPHGLARLALIAVALALAVFWAEFLPASFWSAFNSLVDYHTRATILIR